MAHHIKLAAEIAGYVLAGLIVIPLILTAIRGLFLRRAAPWTPGDVAEAERQAAAEWWPHRSLVALDIFYNVVVLRGQQNETISTHAWRASLLGHRWGIAMCVWLDWWQPNHGPQAASGDLQRSTARVSILSKLLQSFFSPGRE